MAGVYRLRHPERTVLYKVLFHYFDRFQAEYESRFEREYGFFRSIIKQVVERRVLPFLPRKIAFLTDYAVVDRIIDHLKLTFIADKPPLPQAAFQELLMAAETSADYFF